MFAFIGLLRQFIRAVTKFQENCDIETALAHANFHLKIHAYELRVGSYAGLHCVVIKGYSKSAGYQPGVCFEDNRFRNSWNAVYVAGAWRFVQCNWGARHLVNAKEVPRPGQAKAKNDSLRCDSIVQR